MDSSNISTLRIWSYIGLEYTFAFLKEDISCFKISLPLDFEITYH